MGLGVPGEPQNCPCGECPGTSAYCTGAWFCSGPLKARGGVRGWGRPSWGEDSSWGSRRRRRNPDQAIFAHHRALPAGLALPRNQVLSFQAKRLSSEAKFCCSSYLLLPGEDRTALSPEGTGRQFTRLVACCHSGSPWKAGASPRKSRFTGVT